LEKGKKARYSEFVYVFPIGKLVAQMVVGVSKPGWLWSGKRE
jgi:hypothetical protein